MKTQTFSLKEEPAPLLGHILVFVLLCSIFLGAFFIIGFLNGLDFASQDTITAIAIIVIPLTIIYWGVVILQQGGSFIISLHPDVRETLYINSEEILIKGKSHKLERITISDITFVRAARGRFVDAGRMFVNIKSKKKSWTFPVPELEPIKKALAQALKEKFKNIEINKSYFFGTTYKVPEKAHESQ